MKTLSVLLLASVLLTACRSSSTSSSTPLSGANTSRVQANRKPSSSAEQIAIPPGGTSVRYRGTLEANKDAEFIIGEEQGTILTAHALTAGHDLDIAIYRADTGERIRDEQPSNPTFFVAQLPATLGYLVVVHGAGSATTYTLDIEAPFKLSWVEASPKVEITRSTPANSVVSYVSPPAERITAELTSASSDAYLTVHALDGRALLKAEANSRKFAGRAGKPKEGVIISFHQGSANSNFTLLVKEQ